jgi:hypothetical protein
MGRWQNKVEKVRLSPPQNLLNTDERSSVGFVVTSDEHSVNFTNNSVEAEHHYLVDSIGLPLHHCNEEPHGDSTWIKRRLKRVAQHRQVLLADEYANLYLHAYTEEANSIKKENKARATANIWLLRVTKHTSQK